MSDSHHLPNQRICYSEKPDFHPILKPEAREDVGCWSLEPCRTAHLLTLPLLGPPRPVRPSPAALTALRLSADKCKPGSLWPEDCGCSLQSSLRF